MGVGQGNRGIAGLGEGHCVVKNVGPFRGIRVPVGAGAGGLGYLPLQAEGVLVGDVGVVQVEAGLLYGAVIVGLQVLRMAAEEV